MDKFKVLLSPVPSDGRIVAMVQFQGTLIVACEHRVYTYESGGTPLGFDDWCAERGYDFDTEQWSGQLICDYMKRLAQAHTEYLEWRLDNADL